MKNITATMIGMVLGILALHVAVPEAEAYQYSKCRTVQGTIIVVSGYQCPPGTVWIGMG